MILNDTILDMLSERIGQDVRIPAGANALTLDLQTKYGNGAPSLNTVKRLVGILPETNPHHSTLNCMASFLGYPDWRALKEDTVPDGSGFKGESVFKDMSEIETGALVEVAWNPDRRLLLRHDGSGQYTVLNSENSKLLPGDLLRLSKLAIAFPFVADKVFRDEEFLGSYRSADGTALHLLNILTD